jgi:hypothetical protein
LASRVLCFRKFASFNALLSSTDLPNDCLLINDSVGLEAPPQTVSLCSRWTCHYAWPYKLSTKSLTISWSKNLLSFMEHLLLTCRQEHATGQSSERRSSRPLTHSHTLIHTHTHTLTHTHTALYSRSVKLSSDLRSFSNQAVQNVSLISLCRKYHHDRHRHFVSCHRPFLPGNSLEPAVIPTAQVSSFRLQYFPYYVVCVMFQLQLPSVANLLNVFLVWLLIMLLLLLLLLLLLNKELDHKQGSCWCCGT